MHPGDLKANQFSSYPPQARQLAVNNLTLFRRLPEILLPILLQEVISYDWKFPAERKDLEDQLSFLNSLPPAELQTRVGGVYKIETFACARKIRLGEITAPIR